MFSWNAIYAFGIKKNSVERTPVEKVKVHKVEGNVFCFQSKYTAILFSEDLSFNIL